MKTSKWWSPITLSALVVCGLMACSVAQGTIAKEAAVEKIRTAPLHMPMHVVRAASKVEVRTAHSKHPLALEAGGSTHGVTLVSTRAHGAIFTLGNQATPIAKLWLDTDSEAKLGTRPDGTIRVIIKRGKARLSMLQDTPSAEVLGAKGLMNVSGEDILITAGHGKTRPTAKPTLGHIKDAEWTFALSSQARAAGIGTLSTRSPAGSRAHLSLVSLDLEGRRVGDAIAMEVEHIFHNASEARLEGTFRFPMPEGAILTGLSMEIGGQLMDGELVERKKARKIYNKIVDSMQDPALLEWEKGNIFKLRVFPIEPTSNKRIILKYLMPLEQTPEGLVFRYQASTPALKSTIGRFRLSIDGKTIKDVAAYRPRGTISVPIAPKGRAVTAYEEVLPEGTYTAMRVTPNWERVAAPVASKPRSARDVVVVFDTSRSQLESRKLALQSLKVLLANLKPADRFVVLASDVTVRPHAPELQKASPAQLAHGVSFVENIAPDGASDLGLAFERAASYIRQVPGNTRHAEIIYIGDGTATWGVTDDKDLTSKIHGAVGDTPMHAVIVGRRKEAGFFRDLTEERGGWVTVPRRDADVRRFAFRLKHRNRIKRLTGAKLQAGDKSIIYSQSARTVFEGQSVEAVFFTPKDAAKPHEVTLHASVNGETHVEQFPVGTPPAADGVAKRWAAQHIRQMQKKSTPREAVVALSLKHQVMSRYTAFLVLENEEAYKKHRIARRAKKAAQRLAKARISGANLNSVGPRSASLTPGRFQPGDPEVRIPAPANARSVTVVFPFGTTKEAVYEPNLGVWTVRFLVDKQTQDGRYTIRVRINHADGRLEMMTLNYTVDTLKPSVWVRLREARNRPGTYRLEARQRITRTEIKQVTADATGSLRRLKKRYATMVTDVKRVEVQLPDGTVLPLTAIRTGRFRSYFKPNKPLEGPITIRVIATDRAGNHRVVRVTLDPSAPKWRLHD